MRLGTEDQENPGNEVAREGTPCIFSHIGSNKEMFALFLLLNNLCGQEQLKNMMFRIVLLYLTTFSGFFHFCKQENLPTGHLQPLGSHRAADGMIKSLDYVPRPAAFYTEYVLTGQPVIFKGAAKLSSGFNLWTDGYIR